MKADVSIRRRILEAALDIVEQQGVRALTQPRVAKAAGVRQSHLTYYFPRKADLFVALLEASHERVASGAPAKTSESFEEVMQTVSRLILDTQRMRFFLSIVIETGDAENLRPIVAERARSLAEKIAPFFGRSSDDSAIVTYIDALRGIGLRMLIDPDEAFMKRFDAAELAAGFGLKPIGAAR